MQRNTLSFPNGFVWGTATAAYQIEGAVTEGGRGQSIWDTFSHHDRRVKNGDTGDIATDHYHRWQQDIALMRRLNVNAYRFSVAWPRIFPQGRGRANQAGLDFYSKLVDGLLEAGITPYVTLYHWDLPQTLEDESGWLRRGIVEDFAEYADEVSRCLGDRVKHWITFNEPWVFSWLGYVFGIHAPGHMTGNPAHALEVSHHALLAHGRAVRLLRDNVRDGQVGITFNLVPVYPASDSPQDIAAARRYDGYQNRWYLDAVFKGKYPEDMLQQYAIFQPQISHDDLDIISAPIDFLGVNYYTRAVIADEPEQFGLQARQVIQDGEHTAMDWEVYPDGLYDLLARVHNDYQPKAIYITENGAAYDDVVSDDGFVHDTRRAEYLRVHLEAASRAIEDGVPLAGYFLWTLMDNFEWAEGYGKRFGVYYVDFKTQERTLKDSGRFFAQVAGGVFAPAK